VSLVSIPCSDTVESFLACFQHYFTPLEWKGIKSCNWDTSHSELHAFFRLWCLKEAYTKALGLGLGLDLLKIEFRMDQAAFWRNRDGNVQVIFKISFILAIVVA
jgi:phosphopantetheinyl transferase